MAVLHRFPNYSSLSSHNICSYGFSRQQQQQEQLVRDNHRHRPRTILLCASSSSSSSKNSRDAKVGKSAKSNAHLCEELREFVSILGFPQGHVPSFKELREHGRMDLANVVRRRGYKVITELLTNSRGMDTHAEIVKAIDSCKDESVGQGQESSESTEDLLLLNDDTKTDTHFSRDNAVPPLISSIETHGFTQSGTSSSLLEKASKFIKDGELDKSEDDDLNIGDGTFNTSCMDEEIELGSFVGKISDEVSENVDTSVSNSSHSASKMVLPLEIHSSDVSPVQRFHHFPSQNDLDIQSCVGDDQHEINHLKAVLHQKELELHQLKEQIEKEKLALSTLQAKAENEIGKAQKVQSSKDEELHTVEEGLYGLKEVQIEYWCNGDIVEVAGSFNGWHHKVKMDSLPLSTSVRPAELRNTRVWSTVLWLYPGIYEIKFVVDGQWMIDPQRESVSRGSIHNNILRVDR